MSSIRRLLSCRSFLMNVDLMVMPPGMVVTGLRFICWARHNHHDWDWLVVLWVYAILPIALLGLLWRRGIVALEIGIFMQALVYAAYLEIARYHFRGYFSLPIAIFNVALITSGFIRAYNEGEKECDEQMQSKDSGQAIESAVSALRCKRW